MLYSCNTFYKQYQDLNSKVQKSELYLEQLRLIQPILSKEKKPFILIINWDKNILTKDILTYRALIYFPQNGEKKLLKTTKAKPDEIITSSEINNENFKELAYILDNYLNGKEEYLLTLHDSFSSSEMNAPYYIYDFIKNKKLKIKSFFFDKEGKIMQ